MEKGQGSFYLKGNNNQGILICHGLSRTPDDMKEMGVYLNELGYTVSCPEYKGHGTDMENFSNTDVDMWYKSIERAYLDLDTKVEGVFIMGLSMGGTFTVKLAQNYHILGLVIMNAPLISFPLKETFDSITNGDNNLEEIAKEWQSVSKYNRFVVETGQTVNLKKITAPLLVIQGCKDKDRFKISSSMLIEYVSSKYKSRLDFKESGHLIVLEEERLELFDLIANFLYEINKIFN